jgi:CO dehydrogenase/acetyl-CoA synthase beta subunit
VKAFDDLIKDTYDLLKPLEAKSFSYDENNLAVMGDRNELILQKETAYELGAGGYDSLSFLAVSQDSSLVNKDEVILIGPDLGEIKKDCSYARIVYLLVDDVEKNGPDSFYEILKNIEISKYNVSIKGFMIRASALTFREQVRVSKEAIKNKLTFAQIGNQFIHEFRKDPHVLGVKIIFLTANDGPYQKLEFIANKANERSEAYNHMLKDSIMNCKKCAWKPVCAEVGEMKEFHKKMAGKGKSTRKDI